MTRVGLTGGCCSGKTTVAEMFSRLGAEVVSADTIVHRLLQEDAEVKSAVTSVFGEEVAAADGSINRKKLADIVFNDEQSLKWLTDSLYPKVRCEIKRKFEEAESGATREVCVAEVPMLIEGGALDLYDIIVVVRASYDSQLKRSLKRGGSKDDLDRRIKNQMSQEEKAKFADYVIDNDGSVEETFRQVERVYEEIRLGKRPPPPRLMADAAVGSETKPEKRKRGK